MRWDLWNKKEGSLFSFVRYFIKHPQNRAKNDAFPSEDWGEIWKYHILSFQGSKKFSNCVVLVSLHVIWMKMPTKSQFGVFEKMRKNGAQCKTRESPWGRSYSFHVRHFDQTRVVICCLLGNFQDGGSFPGSLNKYLKKMAMAKKRQSSDPRDSVIVKVPTLGIEFMIKVPWSARHPPLGLNIDRCIIIFYSN